MANAILMKFKLSNIWVLYVSDVASIIIILVMIYGKLTRKLPVNYFLLFTFTALEVFMASYTTIYFQPTSVLACAGLTLIIVFGLKIYVCFTVRDIL